MLTRIITAIVLVIIVLPVIIFSGTFIFPVAVAILSLVSTVEMMQCAGCCKRLSFSIPAALISVLMPLGAWFISNKGAFLVASCAILYLFMLAQFFGSVLSLGKIKVSQSAFWFASVFYVCVGYTSIVLLRQIRCGEFLYLLVFVIACVTDIFAYFTGRLFGRHKLIEAVSPKKTVEGAIGGLVFCAIGCTVYGFVVSKISGLEPNYIILAFIGLILSVISQFGDLVASLIKREFYIKDFGKILPGHGGFLDRFDSAVAIAPVLLIICSLSGLFSVFS